MGTKIGEFMEGVVSGVLGGVLLVIIYETITQGLRELQACDSDTTGGDQ